MSAVGAFGAPTGAQQVGPAVTPIIVDGSTRNSEQRISDGGRVVAFESTLTRPDGTVFTRVMVHDRSTGASWAVPESRDAGGARETFNPAVSADGCIVTYSTFAAAVTDPPDESEGDGGKQTPTTVETTTTVASDAGDGTTDDRESRESTADENLSSTQASVEAPAPIGLARQSDPIVTPASSELRAVDRCAALEPASSTLVAVEQVGSPLPSAALSADGAFVAYSNGADVVRLQRTSAGFTLTSVFDSSPVPGPDVATGPNLDMSADGSVVVFEAGPDFTPADASDPVAYGVHAWTAGAGVTPPAVRRVATSSSTPSVSGDAGVIVFRAGAGSDAAVTGVVAQIVSAEGAVANVSVAPFGSSPDVSSDGHHVVYNTGAGVEMASSVGDGPLFAGVEVTDLAAPVEETPALGPAATGPRVTGFGDAVAVDPLGVSGISPFVAVRTVPASITFDQPAYDLGSGNLGDELTTPVVISNDGPASVAITDDQIRVDAPFVAAANGCVGVLGPRSTCTVEVSLTVDALDDVAGTITVTSAGVAPASAELTALAAAPTTVQGSTVPPPAETVAPTPSVPVVTAPPVTTRPTVRVVTPIVTAAPTFEPIIEIDLVPVFEPTMFDFVPTIVNAGSRTASLEIVNPSSSTESLAAVIFSDPASGMSVLSHDCAELGVGTRCAVTIVFAPVTEGEISDQIVATFESGARTTATVTGVGAPPPALAIIPRVATVGQVVTVQGSGFPAGSTVPLSFRDGIVELDVVVDDSGVFNVPVVVLPNTPPGPVVATVTGQEGVFGGASAEMLVTKTASVTSPALLGSLGANVGR